MSIKIGPAGLGGVKQAEKTLGEYSKLGFKACEIAFTYGVYIKNKEDAVRIGRTARKQDIRLSIHAPYWINLNSKEKEKIQKSKERILRCCKIGDLLGAYRVVFHPGYYSSLEKKETYENIKNSVIEIQEEIKKHKWKVKLAPETTGKLNVFGSIDEIKKLVKDTNCSFCIDFAHLFARSKGKTTYKEMVQNFKEFKNLHCHFSGINYGEKGEKSHKETPESEIKKLLKALPKNKDIVLINESPNPVKDSVKTLKILKSQ